MDKLDWSRNHLQEERREKETALQNTVEEYQEAEDHAYHPLAEELEIESINLAMEVIDGISKDIHRQVDGDFEEEYPRFWARSQAANIQKF